MVSDFIPPPPPPLIRPGDRPAGSGLRVWSGLFWEQLWQWYWNILQWLRAQLIPLLLLLSLSLLGSVRVFLRHDPGHPQSRTTSRTKHPTPHHRLVFVIVPLNPFLSLCRAKSLLALTQLSRAEFFPDCHQSVSCSCSPTFHANKAAAHNRTLV